VAFPLRLQFPTHLPKLPCMRPKLPKSLRARLLLATISAFVPLVGLYAFTQAGLRQEVEAEWANRSAAATEEIAQTYARTLARLEEVVVNLATLPELQLPMSESCEDAFQPLMVGLPDASKLGILGMDGRPICITPDDGREYDVSGLEYFQRAVRTGDFTLSEFFFGETAELPLVTASKLIVRPDGSPVGLLTMGINVEKMTESIFPDPGLTTVVIGSDRRMLARVPASSTSPVGSMVEPLLVEPVVDSAISVVVGDDQLGTGMRYLITPLDFAGMPDDRSPYLAVGYDPAAVAAEVDHLLFLNLAGILLVVIGLFATLWAIMEFVFLRRLKWIMRASNNLGRGDHTARTHLEYRDDELGQLARTFDEMADRLQESREQEARAVAMQLAERDTRLRQIVQHIDAAFWMWDPKSSRMLYLSPAFEVIWGRPVAEALDRPRTLVDTIHPEDRDRVRSERLTGDMEEGDDEYRILRPDGEERWIHTRTVAVRNEAGEITRYLGTAADITERKRLEESLRRSQRLEAVGLLAGGVAHDFNNVLTAIRGHAHMLLDDLDARDPMRDDIGEIDAAAERATALTRQLLAFSRKQAYRPGVISPNELIEKLMSMARRLVDSTIEVEWELAEELPAIVADGPHLEQAVLNLIVNARDAMPEGGTLSVRTRLWDQQTDRIVGTEQFMPAREFVCIQVVDTGEGMDDSALKYAFEPFFTTKEPGKGTGLGLASTYGSVKQCGGYVWIDSSVGVGTTVSLFFPPVHNADDMLDQKPDETTAAAPRGTGRILLAEDEASVRAVARRSLARAGYEVSEAVDGQNAYEIFLEDQDSFDLLLTDVVMPRLTGPELSHKVKELRPEMPVVFMSGYPGRGPGSDMLADEEAAFLQKPFTSAALAEIVEVELSLSRD
jgi:PAS domain S-box-containing protein